MPTWSTASDWDAAQSEQGMRHEQPAETNFGPAGSLEKGWPAADWDAWGVPAPYLYYPLQEAASPSTVNDVSGNGRDGTPSGPTFGNSGGPLNNGYASFDGTDDRIDYTFSAGGISYPFTLGVFFKTGGSSIVMLSVADKDDTSQQHRLKLSNAGNVEASSFDGNLRQTSATGIVNDNTWHFGVARFVGASERYAYRDGGNEGSNTGSVAISDLDRVTVGVSADSSPFGFFNGNLAHAIVWNQDLTATQISELWEAFAGTSTHISSKKQL